MYNVEPKGLINLCKTPLENDYKNQLTFSNLESQINYFNSVIVKSFSEYTYIRTDNSIKVGANIDDIINCNYLFYQNNGFTDKIYYCFITNMQYVNENCTLITFETDVFQTYQFNIVYKNSFVEREHVNDDTIGLHTIPENLELGDYVLNSRREDFLADLSNYVICMAVTELPDESVPPYTNNRVYNGIFGGLYYLAFDTANDCQNAITIYNKLGKSDAINSLFMIPKNMSSYQNATTTTWSISQGGEVIGSATLKYLKGSDNADTIGNINIDMPTKLGNNYTPKNNKLFTYPYCFLNLTNNTGITETFKYEDFTKENETPVISFWVDATITPGMSIKAIPLFYKNENINYNYGIMGGKLPVCSYNTDVYLNWLRQNGLNSVFNVIGGVISTAGGIGSGNIGATVGGLSNIYNALHQYTITDMTPNQAKGNTNGGDVNFSDETCGLFSVYKMSIKDEYAKIIDDYFSMFGYKVNIVKVPNITGRSNWNYVKTIDCNFDGDIPQAHLNIIRSIFNSGITLWHNPSTMYNYNVDNSII